MENCCPADSHGYLQMNNYVECGTKLNLDDGTEAYASGIIGSKNAVLLIPDVWGWGGGRIRGIADYLASQGYYVVVPKLLLPAVDGGVDGDALPANFNGNVMAFIATISWDSMKPRIAAVLHHIKSTGASRVLGLGFCWGVWTLCKVSLDFPGSLAAAAWPHPSSAQLEMHLYQRPSTELVEHITYPVLLMPAGNDPDVYRHGGEVFSALHSQNPATQLVEFANQKHGWLARGDTSYPEIATAVQVALARIVEFFAEYALKE